MARESFLNRMGTYVKTNRNDLFDDGPFIYRFFFFYSIVERVYEFGVDFGLNWPSSLQELLAIVLRGSWTELNNNNHKN